VLSMQILDKQTVCQDLFSGRRVLVVGLGKTGLSCVRFLRARGVEVAVMDSRLQPPGLPELKQQYPDVAVFLGDFDETVIMSSDVLVVSPGVAIANKAIVQASQAGKEILGDIEIFARCVSSPTIAITGSNGKSTVTTLVGEMIRLARREVKVAGNIGVPVLDLVDDAQRSDVFVVELSSFQLETTQSLHAVASVVLNVSEDHMDRYTSLEDYAAAKQRIFQGDGVVVLNRDDPRVTAMAGSLAPGRRTYYFTLGEPDAENVFGIRLADNQPWLSRGNQMLLPVSAIRIQGQHNVANVLASLALATAIDLPVPAMLEAIQTFPGLAHRTQWVTEHAGVNWYNDSKATNVGAALAALEGLAAEKLVVLMGGQGKGQDFAPLRDVLQRRARHVLLFGQDAQLLANALGKTVPYTIVENMSVAVLKAKALARSGDAVLLSPACASFDMFDGYEHRGRMFMQMVGEVTQ